MLKGQAEISGQVQQDESYVTVQGGRVWMATAMAVFPHLFLGGTRIADCPHQQTLMPKPF